MSSNQSFQEINQEITTFVNHLFHKFNNPEFDHQTLEKKYISRLTGKIYNITNDPKQSHHTKDIFLNIFESHATNFINNYIILDLIKCNQEVMFAETLAKRWVNYKFFVFNFYAFLIHCKDYYQSHKISEINKSKEKNTVAKKQFEVFPIPVLAIKLLNKLVLQRLHNRIKKTMLSLLQEERQLNGPSNISLKLIFEMIWSCSLKELGRIGLVKGNVMFVKQERVQFTNVFKEAIKNEDYIMHYIIYDISHQIAHLYSNLYTNKLFLINPIEQLEEIHKKCTLEESIANFHIPTKKLVNFYCNCVYIELILYDFDVMITKANSFKEVIKKYSFGSKDYQQEIQTYFDVFYRVQEAVIEKVIKILMEAIEQKGTEIRGKLTRPKQFIIEMLDFKKSIRKIFAITKTNSFRAQMSVEKGFKALMQGYETSKALSQFTDFSIRQCNRLKLDEENCEVKFKDIMLLLESVSAKDLFLIYHQDLMAKRLLDSLNEPKVEVQKIFLRFLAENLGNFLVNQHLAMIKDMETSLQMTQKISIKIPFISYKWDLKIINPSVWPDSVLKNKFTYIKPPVMLMKHLNQIEQLYKENKGGLFLKWRLQKGVSLFEGKFTKTKYRFQSENIYMIILLHLNEQQNYTMKYSDLIQLIADKKENQKISHLNNYMKVLAQNRLIIRNSQKDPHSEFQTEEIVALNQDYTAHQHKPGQTIIIKMSPQLIKILNQNNVEVNKVIKDRQKLIDALLVKMLKHAHSSGNKSITFAELYQGVITNSFLKNFNFSQTVVKERLQQLILKEYCERDQVDRKIYRYIA